MSQTQHYTISQTGEVNLVTVTRARVNTTDEIIRQFAGEVSVKLPGIASASLISPKLLGSVGLSVRGGAVALTLRIGMLPLRAQFMVEGGVLVPDFRNETGATVSHFEWAPPSGMSIYLIISMVPGIYTANEQYLIAVDTGGRHWRLPVSNCYENGRLCHGKYDGSGLTYIDAAAKAWVQFEKSQWQSDLVDRGGVNGPKYSKLMFRFKPLEKEGFEQLPIEASDWTSLCTKVGADFVTNNLVIIGA